MSRKLAMVALALLAGLYCLSSMPSHPSVKGASVPHVHVLINSTSHGIQGQPGLSGAQIDAILCGQQSPACGTGQELYTLGQQYHISSDYALAFFQHESSFGKFGIAARNKGLGNIRCTAGYACINGFRAYSSWVAGYQDWYALIHYYIQVLHKQTIEQIVPTYAPSVENDTQAYIASVITSVEGWQKKVA